MKRFLVIALVLCAMSFAGYAELQQVQIGGEIRIRPRGWSDNYNRAIGGPREARYPFGNVVNRPLGPFGLGSRFAFEDETLAFVEQRTRLNVGADFTDNVRAFIELESYDIWGTDFRSDYISGLDMPGGPDVNLYQAYIEANEMWGQPLRLRIGRQEIKLGKGWLVDDITTAIIGRSWDAVRLTWTGDNYSVDAIYSKLAEAFAGDDDVNLYGIYANYDAIEALSVSAYWLLVRDAGPVDDTVAGIAGELLEDLFDLDQYENTYLHTVGLRLYGGAGNFDYDWELAYQFGEADAAGFLFKNPFGYGDHKAEWDSIGTDLEIGYTFDCKTSPRIYLGGAYYEGEDNREIGIIDYLLGGFYTPESSLSFNRLFPGKNYSPLLGIGQELTNFWAVRTGVVLKPTDKIATGLRVQYLEINDVFDRPTILPLITRESADDIGWTTLAFVKYQYSKDLSFKLVWEHLFHGEALEDGNYWARNGLGLVKGRDNSAEDGDYIHLDIQIKF